MRDAWDHQAVQKRLVRRGVTLTQAHADLYRSLFEETTSERRRILREAENRRWRRSA